jgi:hypothetical protein
MLVLVEVLSNWFHDPKRSLVNTNMFILSIQNCFLHSKKKKPTT